MSLRLSKQNYNEYKKELYWQIHLTRYAEGQNLVDVNLYAIQWLSIDSICSPIAHYSLHKHDIPSFWDMYLMTHRSVSKPDEDSITALNDSVDAVIRLIQTSLFFFFWMIHWKSHVLLYQTTLRLHNTQKTCFLAIILWQTAYFKSPSPMHGFVHMASSDMALKSGSWKLRKKHQSALCSKGVSDQWLRLRFS